MKNLSYALSCIKKDVYTLLFYFLHLSCIHSSHSLRYPSSLPLMKMPVFQFVAPRHTIFTSSCIMPLWDSATATHPLVKSLTLPLRKMPVFQGVAPRHNFHFILCHSSLGHSNSSLTLW